jgi:hypothetical protein
MRVRTLARWLAVALAATLAGCATAPTAVFGPTLPPRAEALSYFPETSPLVALVATDTGHEGWRRLADAGLLGPLDAAARERRALFVQLRGLLGHELAVGLPSVGAAPLAVLVTSDADQLRILADARRRAGDARPAGTFRGADLFAGVPAYAVRGPVLLIGRSTADLRRALEVKANTDGFDPALLKRALPDRAGDALVRGVGDVRALVARGGPRARAVPVLAALQRAGFALRVDGGAARFEVRLDLDRGRLVERDIPVSEGTAAPRAVDGGAAATVSVRDLAHSLGGLQRAVRAAAPIAALRYEALQRAIGVDADADVISALHGPATVILAPGGPLLHAEPSRPQRIARALRLLLRHPRPARDLRLRRHGDFVSLERDGRMVGRAALIDGVLVAGDAAPSALRRLARRRTTRAPGAGGLAFTAPADLLRDRVPWLPPRELHGAVRVDEDALTVSVSLPL